MNKLILIAVFLILINLSFALPNPAAVYCTQMGYTYNIIKTPKGETGQCTLPDNEKCGGWDFLSGKCGANYSYCVKNGYDIQTVIRGKSENAICIPKGVHAMQSKGIPVTYFINLTTDVKAHQINTPKNHGVIPKISATGFSTQSVSEVTLPTYFDWRNVNGYNWMTPVKDQGDCGSCWDFAAVGAVEANMKIQEYNSSSITPDLSEQDVLSCSGAGDCPNGGNSEPALDYIKNSGTVDEGCFPYQAVDANGNNFFGGGFTPVLCSDRCSNWRSRLFNISAWGYVPPNMVKQYLTTYGPLAVYLAMDGDPDSNGIFTCGGVSPAQDHAVVIVGYNDTGGYWIIKNSWSSDWNGDGYFNLYYNDCNIGNYMYVLLSSTQPAYPPTTVTDLSVANTTWTTMGLHWTAANVSTAGLVVNYYLIKYSTSPINKDNFDSVTSQTFYSSGDPAGTGETYALSGLRLNTTYYAAIKAFDDFGSASNISNVVSGKTKAAVAPGCDIPVDTSVMPVPLNQPNVIYCLMSNITVSQLGSVVKFVQGFASNVTLDCRGFTIRGNGSGIGVDFRWQSMSGTLKNCVITNFTHGIYLSKSYYNLITNDTITSNTYGITFSGSGYNTVTGSRIQNNAYGVYLTELDALVNPTYIFPSVQNSIFNNILNNTNNTLFTGFVQDNSWNTAFTQGRRMYTPGDYVGGNYWTNPSGNGYSDICTDAQATGFCDTPYFIYNETPTHFIDHTPPTQTDGLPYSKNWSAPARFGIPVAAIKTDITGYTYIPNIPNIKRLKIEEWCNMGNGWDPVTDGCGRILGDQAGGTSPYPSIKNWPDGNVDSSDMIIIFRALGSSEGMSNFNYMADVNPDRIIDESDNTTATRRLGLNGTYSSNLSRIMVWFDDISNPFIPDANGYILIPPGASHINVWGYYIGDGGAEVMSLITFYNTTPPIPAAALKGGPNGQLYVPNIPNMNYLKVDLWCNMSDTNCQSGKCGCTRMWCDQAGGKSPYPTIKFWPDGNVDGTDSILINRKFGTWEGSTGWDYMADCVLDRNVDGTDGIRAARNFGQGPFNYSTDLTNIKVLFNNDPGYKMPDAYGYIQIPAGAVNFTVYNGTKPVMALATFYNSSISYNLAAATKPSTQVQTTALMAPTQQMPVGNTWTTAVVLIAIIGLVIGYFVAREAMFSTATRKAKKK